ncbi:MAG: HD domain-containing phosphohydrolase [Deltaproteobacteria bacterium]
MNNTMMRLPSVGDDCHAMVESTSDSLYMVDEYGRYMFINNRHLSRLGLTAEYVIGRAYDDFHSLEETAAFTHAVKEVMATGGSVQQEHQSKRDNRYFLRTFSPVEEPGSGGKITRVTVVSKDITDRKQAEEALTRSEEKFRKVFDTSLDSVNINRLEDGMYISINPGFTRITGYTEGDIIGKTSIEYNVWGNIEDRQRLVAGLRKDGEVINLAAAFRMKCGDIRYGLMSASVIDLDGVPHILSITRDITVRKRAEEDLQRTLESLRKALGTTIQVMVSAVETRDPYTAGHQIRSADLARAIATEIGLPQDRIEGIRMAGSIHDIGKLSIPAEILSKPTKLSEIEFSLIKEHARKGFELLKDVESPWPLAEIVYQHHERMDGSGYPRNLKGDDILMEARILAVADVVEAMASHRPYRPGLGIDAALAEVTAQRGVLYDAEAVDACLRLFRDKGFTFS